MDNDTADENNADDGADDQLSVNDGFRDNR